MRRDAYRRLAVLQLATGAGLILFWVGFFTVGLAPGDPPPGYFAFEHSFPLPDMLLACGLLGAAALLRHDDVKRRARGRTLSLVCAGALLFLAVVDFSFNIQNGLYTTSMMSGIGAAFIQAWCLGSGLIMIWTCRTDAPTTQKTPPQGPA